MPVPSCLLPSLLLSFPPAQFQGKLDTIKQQAPSKPSLKDVVAADKAANTATVSGHGGV